MNEQQLRECCYLGGEPIDEELSLRPRGVGAE